MASDSSSLEALIVRVVRVEVERALRADRSGREETISSRDFEDPQERRAFHSRCRDLAATGDPRVLKIGKYWRAERACFRPAVMVPANDAPPAVFSVDAVVARARSAAR